MTKFITTFKAKAHSKTLTAADMLALCIYRTVKAKSEDKATILDYFVKKSFTPGKVCEHRNYPYQCVSNAQHDLNWQMRPSKRWDGTQYHITSNGRLLDQPIEELLDSEEEALFRELHASLSNYGYKDANK